MHIIVYISILEGPSLQNCINAEHCRNYGDGILYQLYEYKSTSKLS